MNPILLVVCLLAAVAMPILAGQADRRSLRTRRTLSQTHHQPRATQVGAQVRHRSSRA